MKYFLTMITACCLIISCSTSTSQNTKLNVGKFPNLTYNQMLADHDSLVSYIHQVSPIIYFNKEVRGIDFDRYASRLRKEITSETRTLKYLQIVQKTINAAQDGHTSRLGKGQLDIMKKYWIPSGFVKGIDSLSMDDTYRYADYFSHEFYTKLDLNLVYTSGEYYNLLPFSYKGKNYPASMKLISCNGRDIHGFVNTLVELVPSLRWDRVNNRMYEETFYQTSELYQNGILKLIFSDTDNKKYRLNIYKNDTVTFLQKKNWEYGYNSDKDSLITHYFEKQKVFYAKIPAMQEELGDAAKKRLEAIMKNNNVKSVIIDIRGNGGGSDNTYDILLKKIVKDTLRQNIVVGRNFSFYNKGYFKINRDSIEQRTSHTFKVDGPTLKEPSMYYIKQSYDFVVPDYPTLPFDGKIYILQDRYIYSSASNLSNLAKNSQQLVSIGETPDLLGGLQTDPIVLMLPYSKLIFRIEPQIDLTNIKNVKDIFQNNVEYPVHYSIEDLYLRLTTEENIYDKEFLLNHDPMFKKVLDIENE